MKLSEIFKKPLTAASVTTESFKGITTPERGFRNITEFRDKDWKILKGQEEYNCEIAYYLYTKNPLAKRLLHLCADFILGDGIDFQAEDAPGEDVKDSKKTVQEVLTDFWYDNVNAWPVKQYRKTVELALYGEQCYPVFVNEISGEVKLGYIDPTNIAEVITDPNNAEIQLYVKLKSQNGEKPPLYKIIHQDEDPQSATFGMLITAEKDETYNTKTDGTLLVTGSCFFFSINRVSNATRGKSDLLPIFDYLKAYDEMAFDRVERVKLLNYFFYKVTLKGMDDTGIKEWLKTASPPKDKSIIACNDNTNWEVMTPNLQSGDAELEGKMLKRIICTTMGYPMHWLSEGDEANLATAGAMSEPTLKQLTSRQREIRRIIEHIFDFVIDQAIIHNVLSEKVNREFTVIMPDVSAVNTNDLATGIKTITDAALTATANDWVSTETASKLWITQVNALGVEIDPEAEKEKIQNEKAASAMPTTEKDKQ